MRETAIRSGGYDTVRQTLETIETVSPNKLPDSEFRKQMLHGCTQVSVPLNQA